LRFSNELIPEYVYHFLQFQHSKGIIKKFIKKTTNIQNLEVPRFLTNTTIPIPPKKIQENIISILGKFHESVQKRKKVLELNDKLLQSLFQKRFFDKNNGKILKKSVRELSTLITKGDSPLWKGHKYQKTGIPIIRIKNFKNFRIDLTNADYITKQVHDDMKRSQLESGDVLISIAGTLGRLALITDNVCPANMNQDQAVIRFDRQKIEPFFGLYALSTNDIKDQIQSVKGGATRMHLNLKQTGDLQIPVPSLNSQSEFINTAKAIEKSNEKCLKFLNKSKFLYFSLLQNWFQN